MNNWIIQNKFQYDPQKKESLKDLIKNLLRNRGIKTKSEIAEFLKPDLENLNFNNLEIDKRQAEIASKRINQAIKNKEQIVVYTDYDADGICAGAILWETLYSLKARVLPFVPNRLTEGYGLSVMGIDKIKKEINPGLIITVDHGITKTKEVEYAKNLGIDTIIIDHHLPPENLPQALSIVHTTQLCAGGLAWVFANYLKGVSLTKYLDLAAIATVADLVPLIGPNRSIVKFGIERINKTARVGLNALFDQSGIKKGEIDTYSLSHIIAPRLNASGRLTNALDSLRLICTKDKDRAEKLAKELNMVNKNRQLLTYESTRVAITQVIESEKIIFASHTSFHQGVIGLIAGKLVESYKRPAIVVSIGEVYSKASVRSIKGINIVEFLTQAKELLIDLGGHPLAAGFTIRSENLPKLKLKLIEISRTLIKKEDLIPEKSAELIVDPADIDMKFYSELASLAPFGQGNREPVFAGFGLSVIESRLVGREKNHLKLILASPKNPDKYLNAIAFNMAEFYNSAPIGMRVDILYSVDKDDWNGGNRLILKIKDARLAN